MENRKGFFFLFSRIEALNNIKQSYENVGNISEIWKFDNLEFMNIRKTNLKSE